MERMVAGLLILPLVRRTATVILRFNRLEFDLQQETALVAESLRKHALTAQHQVTGLREWLQDAIVIIDEAGENWLPQEGDRDPVWNDTLAAVGWIVQWLEGFQGYVECVLQRDATIPLRGRLSASANLPSPTTVRSICNEAQGETAALRTNLGRFQAYLKILLQRTQSGS